MLHRPHLGVAGAEIEPAQPGEGNGRRTHGAGLERDIEVVSDQPLGAEAGAGGAHRQHLGMGRGIAVGEGPVGGSRDDQPLGVEHHRPDRHFAAGSGFGGKVQGMAHGRRQGHAASIALLTPRCFCATPSR